MKLILKSISPEEFLQVDVRTLASDEVKQKRAEAEKINMYNKRTDWENEEVKAQGDNYKGLFNCENCGSTSWQKFSLDVVPISGILRVRR